MDTSIIIKILKDNGSKFEDIKSMYGYNTREGLYKIMRKGGVAPLTRLRNVAKSLDVSEQLLHVACIRIPDEFMPKEAEALRIIRNIARERLKYDLSINVNIDVVEKDQFGINE